MTDEAEEVRAYAKGRFSEVIEGQMRLDEAHDEVQAFRKRRKWVAEIEKLLKKQEEDNALSPGNFSNLGQELRLREDLSDLLVLFKRVLGR